MTGGTINMLKSKCKFCDNNKAVHYAANNLISLTVAMATLNVVCEGCNNYSLYKPKIPDKDSACASCSKYKKCLYLDKGHIKQCNIKK